MSRIGRKPVVVPDGVTVSLSGRTVSVEGPAGKLRWTHRPELSVRLADGGRSLLVERDGDDRLRRSLHGLTRSLIAGMVEGCWKGYVRALEVYGVGYGVQAQGNRFTVNVGYSHPVVFQVPDGVKVEVQTPQARGETEPARFTIRGADKQAVGELAARIRRIRPPEPYKGKGIRYVGEAVRQKAGKAAKATATK